MANAITVSRITKDQGLSYLFGTIALSGSYVQAAGGIGTAETLDFTKATLPIGAIVPASKGPISFAAFGAAGYNYGTIAAFGALLQAVLKVNTASATELSAGAYPAGVTGDYIQFVAAFDTEI